MHTRLGLLKSPFFFGLSLLCSLAGVSPAFAAIRTPPADMWQSAVHAYLNKNYQESTALLERYLKYDLENERAKAAKFFLAENFRLAGKPQLALPIYQSLYSSSTEIPLKISARFREAELAYNRGDYSRAGSILDELARNSQADFLFPQIRLALVKVDLQLQRYTEAQKIFKELLTAFPRALLDPDIKFLFGIMKEYQGQALDALAIYAELDDNPLATLFGGAILESQGQFLAAVEKYNRVLTRGQTESQKQMALYFKTRAFFKSGDLLSAQQMIKQYLNQYPNGEQTAKIDLLRLLMLKTQARFSELLDLYPQVVKPIASLPEEDRSLACFAQAEAELNLNRYREATTHYTEAVLLTRQNRETILLKLAYANMVQADWDQALQNLNRYFDTAKVPSSFSRLISIPIYLQTHRESLAFTLLKKLIMDRDPISELALYYLCSFYSDHRQQPALTANWVVLEKLLAGSSPEPEFREAAAWSRLLLADAYYRQGDYSQARDYYQKALFFYPYGKVTGAVAEGKIWCSFAVREYQAVLDQSQRLLDSRQPAAGAEKIMLLQAHAEFNLQRYPDAVRAYRAWLNAYPGSPDVPGVLFQTGWAHYLNQAYLDAVQTWKELAQRFPAAPETGQALIRVADTYFQAGENAQARAVYEQLVARDPAAPERKAHELRIAQTYYNEQKDAEAIRRFSALMAAYPGTEEAREAGKGIESASYRMADQLNDLTAFREFVARFPGSTLSEDIQYRIGEAYFQKEKFPDSLQEFQQFILTYTRSPRTPNAQYYVAVCQEELGNTLTAVLQAKAFLKNYPQHELAAEMMFRLASDEFLLERFTEAAEHFAACADQYALKEYQPRAWYNAAVSFEKLKLPERALDYYGKLVTTYPRDVNVTVSLSRLALLNAGQKDAAGVESALRVLQQRGDKEWLQKTWLGLAAIYQDQGEAGSREAILKRIMEGGLDRNEEYSSALVELAALYEQRKDWKDAVRVYQRLEKIASQDKWREAAKKRIKLLQRIMNSAARVPVTCSQYA